MTSAQKIIKYISVGFAIFLAVTIISSILTGLYALGNILGLKKNGEISSSEMVETNFENTNIQSLEIDIQYTNLIIKNGNSLKVETDNNNIKLSQNNKKLEIEEKGHNWFLKNNEGNLIVYIPQDLEFEEINIVAGAGKIDIENLTTKDLSLELGAGETKIAKLNVSQKCDIDGGAGKVDIEASFINNLDLDMGVGETNIAAILTGKNDIDAGIGNLNIKLIGNKEDYRIKTNKGIGTVKIDENSMIDGQVFGNGDNDIEIDGGIGNINVKFE